MKKGLDAAVLCGIIGNVVSVVGVVLCNKYVINNGFRFTMVLSGLHFAATWLGCFVMLKLRHFIYKPAPLKHVLPVALASLGSVAFMNLNLAYNSVGFYQLSKLVCIPFTIALQRLVFKQEPSPRVKLTLVPILLGVGFATVHDISANLVGTLFAILAIVFTTFAQIFTQRYQAVLQCNALQLLYLTSPLILSGMLTLSPLFDDLSLLYATKWSMPLMSWVAASCVLALGVNVTNYQVLGRTSPLTYQVLGHLKTMVIITLGMYMFNTTVDGRQAAGIVVAMAGLIAYTEVKRRESKVKALPLPKYMPRSNGHKSAGGLAAKSVSGSGT